MTRRLACGIVIAAGLLTEVSTAAQADPAARPQFEVASVKPNKSGEAGLRMDIPGGRRLVAVNMPLRELIRAAYTLQAFQIVGAPGWLESERFDITATTDRDLTVTTPWTPGGRFLPVQLMVQSLLADRFRMVAHDETRESQVYALAVDQPGPRAAGQLRPAAPDCAQACGIRAGRGTMTARNVPLPQFAELLSQLTGRLTTDATGLTGTFDMDLQWRPDGQQADASDAPSIFTALREQLGLKLESRRGSIPVLVIDSIERPTPD